MNPLDVRVLCGIDGRAAHPVEFGARAHVDQTNGGVELQKLEGLGGENSARVRQLVLIGAMCGLGVQLLERAHGRVSNRTF